MAEEDTLRDAVQANDLEAIESSLANLPSHRYHDELKESLTLAMPSGSYVTIKLLLDHGAKLEQASFHAATIREDTGIFQLLIDSGWDIDSTEFNYTAIHFALYCEPLLRWLLEHGANPSTMSTRAHGSCALPHTPLVDAAELSDPTALRLLLAHGAALDPAAMLHAIGRRRQDNGTATMEVLIEHGADVNYVSARLPSPLCMAIRRNAVEKLKLLLDHGADPTSQRSEGSLSALEYANTLGHTHLIHIMEAASGRTAP